MNRNVEQEDCNVSLTDDNLSEILGRFLKSYSLISLVIFKTLNDRDIERLIEIVEDELNLRAYEGKTLGISRKSALLTRQLDLNNRVLTLAQINHLRRIRQQLEDGLQFIQIPIFRIF